MGPEARSPGDTDTMQRRRSGRRRSLGLHGGAGGAAQPGQPEAVERRPDRTGTDHRHPGGDALGTDLGRGRGQQLGQVGGQQVVRRRQLAEAEVDDPGGTVVRQEDVGQPQVAVGDAVRIRASSVHTLASTSSDISSASRRSSERPEIASYASTYPLGSALANATTRGVRMPRSRAANATSASRSTARRSDENARRRGRGPDPPVDAEQQIGAALVLPSAFTNRDDPSRLVAVGRRATGIEAGLLQPGQRHADRRQAGRHRLAEGRREGAPSATMAAPAAQPVSTATNVSNSICAPRKRVRVAMITTVHPARRHRRAIHGEAAVTTAANTANPMVDTTWSGATRCRTRRPHI